MSHSESPPRLGKDTSQTGSLPPRQLTSWPADFFPPGLQSSSHWLCPLLVRPESCSLCPWDRKEKHLIRGGGGIPCRNKLKLPDDPIYLLKNLSLKPVLSKDNCTFGFGIIIITYIKSATRWVILSLEKILKPSWKCSHSVRLALVCVYQGLLLWDKLHMNTTQNFPQCSQVRHLVFRKVKSAFCLLNVLCRVQLVTKVTR